MKCEECGKEPTDYYISVLGCNVYFCCEECTTKYFGSDLSTLGIVFKRIIRKDGE